MGDVHASFLWSEGAPSIVVGTNLLIFHQLQKKISDRPTHVTTVAPHDPLKNMLEAIFTLECFFMFELVEPPTQRSLGCEFGPRLPRCVCDLQRDLFPVSCNFWIVSEMFFSSACHPSECHFEILRLSSNQFYQRSRLWSQLLLDDFVAPVVQSSVQYAAAAAVLASGFWELPSVLGWGSDNLSLQASCCFWRLSWRYILLAQFGTQ